MHILSLSSIAGLLALQGSLVAGHGHQSRHDALHALHSKRHHSRQVPTSRAETSPLPAPLFTRGAQITPASNLNPRSFDDVPTKEKRGNVCQFPTDAGLVAVNSGGMNGGWAIPPDTQCTGGMFCPYACPAGQVMAQWDPSATSYTYPQSMNGGLKCNSDGTVSKPLNGPYCKDASGPVSVQDKTGKGCAFCQTTLPGDESMVIPTNIQAGGSQDIAIPDPSYWASTAAHYYINPPGVSTSDGCQWGSNSQPHGNWAPYVAGGNADSSGQVFLKLGWNPIYLEPATPFRDTMPGWGVEVVCDGAGCNGLPCAIDPSKNKVNEMVGGQGNGAGGANFCVVTVPKGVKASLVVFSGSADSGSAISASSAASKPSSSSAASPSPSSSSQAPASSSAAPTTSAPASSSSSVVASTTSALSISSAASSSASASYSYAPHQMLMNTTNNSTSSLGTGTMLLPSPTVTGGANGAATAPSKTSPIAGAKSTGAAPTNMVHGGLVAAAAVAAMAIF